MLFSLSVCSPALSLLRSNPCVCLFDLGCARSAGNAKDLAGASSTFPRAPAIQVHDTHIPDAPKTPSTPYNEPTHATRPLGEQHPDFSLSLHVSSTLRASCEGDGPGSLIQRSTAPFKPAVLAVGVRALAALARVGLAKPMCAGDLGQIWPNNGPRRFFLFYFPFSAQFKIGL